MNLNYPDNLRVAIIEQAVSDLKTANIKIKKHPDSRDLMYKRRECERFFRSEWFNLLVDYSIDGNDVIQRLRGI